MSLSLSFDFNPKRFIANILRGEKLELLPELKNLWGREFDVVSFRSFSSENCKISFKAWFMFSGVLLDLFWSIEWFAVFCVWTWNSSFAAAGCGFLASLCSLSLSTVSFSVPIFGAAWSPLKMLIENTLWGFCLFRADALSLCFSFSSSPPTDLPALPGKDLPLVIFLDLLFLPVPASGSNQTNFIFSG